MYFYDPNVMWDYYGYITACGGLPDFRKLYVLDWHPEAREYETSVYPWIPVMMLPNLTASAAAIALP